MQYVDERYAVFTEKFTATLLQQSEVWPVYVNSQYSRKKSLDEKVQWQATRVIAVGTRFLNGRVLETYSPFKEPWHTVDHPWRRKEVVCFTTAERQFLKLRSKQNVHPLSRPKRITSDWCGFFLVVTCVWWSFQLEMVLVWCFHHFTAVHIVPTP